MKHGGETEHEREETKVEEKVESEKPFFDCKVDEDIMCKRDIIRAQNETTSKCMDFARTNMNKWVHKIFYTVQDD